MVKKIMVSPFLKKYYVAIKNDVTDKYIIIQKDIHYNENAGYKLYDTILVYGCTHTHTQIGRLYKNIRDYSCMGEFGILYFNLLLTYVF